MDDARIMADMAEILNRLKAVEANTNATRFDVAEIKGRLANMPTTFQVLTWFVGTALALSALVFAIARLTAH